MDPRNCVRERIRFIPSNVLPPATMARGGEPDLPAAGYAVIEIVAKNAQNTHMTTVTADGLILSEKIGTYYLFRDAGNLLHRYSGAREGVVGVDK